MEKAAELFLRQGYEKTPVAQILEQTGVGAGSFYYYFKSKEDLLLAVLDRYKELFPVTIQGPAFAETDDPIERVFHVLGLYRRYLIENQFKLGCPIGNIALEMGPLIPEVRERTTELFRIWRKMIQRCLEEAGDRLPGDLNREELATLVLTVVEGGVMQALSAGNIGPFDGSARQLRRYFEYLQQSAREDLSLSS